MAGLDITPKVPAGRTLIQGYGGGGFRINGVAVAGSHLVFPGGSERWRVDHVDALTPESLHAVTDRADTVRILLIGCGRTGAPPRPAVAEALRAHGIVAEWMDTGAACRTFNVLVGEDRPVAAALIAID